MKLSRLFIFTIIFLVNNFSFSQEKINPRESPLSISSMKFKDEYVKITYSQPHKRGKKIFGSQVPFGKIWRTGDNEATELTTTSDLLIANDTLKAGTYSIFSIPKPNSWTIIFNQNLGQWGNYNYVEKDDVLRIEIESTTIKDVVYEPFTILLEQNNKKAKMIFLWDKTKVIIPIQFILE